MKKFGINHCSQNFQTMKIRNNFIKYNMLRIMKYSGILVLVFTLLMIVSVFAYAAAESQIVIVDARESERLTFNLIEGDYFEYWISVDGGRNDDVNFKLRNPIGGTMVDGRIAESYSDSWYAQYDGNYVFEFDNGMSLVSDKRVDFTYEITKKPTVSRVVEQVGGGCLIATATYGTELAPQVQMLREIRDNSLLQTESGRSFMESFNQFYYSFSPTIADLERENPVFKEVVKLTITPLLSSLSLLNYVDMNSESQVLGYGISLILLNVGMYFVIPAFVIHRVRKFVYS